ncbi:MAG: hypothetical protein ACREB7_10710 [Sphingopyxis sp.]|uniref:hypothetical protein n=1 Tax=Sphingopyxis sp. TaxID=1908224 RepID=UPI003D6CE6DB
MNIDHRLMLAGVIALPLMAACTPIDATMGNAVKQSFAAQVVDPDPRYDERQETQADKVVPAVVRYRSDQVKKPDTIRTTDTKSGAPQ